MNKLMIMIVATVAAELVAVPALAYTVSHWDFSSDPAGEIDITGHNDLKNNGGVTIQDGAAVFDGTAREFITGHEVDLRGNRPYTFECFALAETDCNGMIMEVSPNNNSIIGGFFLYATEGVMARTTSGGYNGERFIGGTICDGQWHHLAVIIDPTTDVVTNSVQLYVDGVRQGVRSNNGGSANLSPRRFCIGSRNGTSLPFKGKIDDVRITEGILSPSEFLQTRSSEALDVRAYWKFDSANPLADSSGNGNTLQGSQGVTFADGCASFNGTVSDVRTANTLDLSAYKDVTVEFFIRKHLESDDTAMIMELSQNAVSTAGGFYLTLNEGRVGAIWGLFRLVGNQHHGLSPTYAVNTGWHHVALIKDSSNAGKDMCISLYVDGIRMTEYTGDSTKNSSNLLRNDYLYLGSRANNSFFLDADIDDVRITANVLQPGQFLRTRTGALDDAIAYWPFKKGKLLADATGNGNALTGSGVTASDDGAAVFDGSQSGFSTLAPLPLYLYKSMTVEWFMKSSMNGTGIAMELSPDYNDVPGAFGVFVNDSIGYKTFTSFNAFYGWATLDDAWHHYALVYDWDLATSDIVRLYRDGVQVTVRNTNYGNACASRIPSVVLYIGARNGSTLPFVGELDDIKITGRALAPADFMTERSIPKGTKIVVR